MTDKNPYSFRNESIDEELVKETIDFSKYYVKRRIRLANHIIDTIVYYAIAYFVSDLLFMRDFAILDFDGWEGLAMYVLVPLLLWGAYFALFETNTQKSVGKMVTGTKVVTIDGKKPDSSTILLRTLCRFVPFDALSFLGTINKGWHDSWSKTIVVQQDFPELD